jgi:hypothetical protein
LLLLLATACGQQDAAVRPNPTNRKPDYFDVQRFLDAQVTRLSQQQPPVEKQVKLRDGRPETTRVAKTEWSKELQVFYQANINKPALRGAYTVVPVVDGRRYQRTPGLDAPVTQLTVTGTGQTPDVLTAIIKQDNPLFYSEKRLRLRTHNGLLTEYEVVGVQKLIMFDTVRYSVRTRVVR